VAKYPESLQGLAHVIRTSNIGNDVAFAASLISTLVLASDRVDSLRASAVLRELPNRVQDFQEYFVRRELLRVPVEGGEKNWLPKAIQLLTTEGLTGKEQRYLTSYGWTVDLVQANIERKLKTPTLRDAQLGAEYLETMGDVFMRGRKGRRYRQNRADVQI
jgi:hypothetical protein